MEHGSEKKISDISHGDTGSQDTESASVPTEEELIKKETDLTALRQNLMSQFLLLQTNLQTSIKEAKAKHAAVGPEVDDSVEGPKSKYFHALQQVKGPVAGPVNPRV